jgi:hypothetical protein
VVVDLLPYATYIMTFYVLFSTIHFKSAGRTTTLSCELGLSVFSTGSICSADSIGSIGSTDSSLDACSMFRDLGYKSSFFPNPLPPDRVIAYPVLPRKDKYEFTYLFCIGETYRSRNPPKR